MKNFKKLKVWQKGLDISVALYQVTALLPKTEEFGLKQQMQKAAISITSNIAEGSSRSSNKDYKRFLEYALGSCFEIESQILTCVQLNLVSEQKTMLLLDMLTEEMKMLHKLISMVGN